MSPCPVAALLSTRLHVQLNPILPDLEYLGDQHLLLSIKGVDSCESYGACGMVPWGSRWWHGGVPSIAPAGLR